MKVKLIKEDNEYYLEDSLGDTIYSTDKILLKETDTVKRLSLKNCQAIENGYDLDVLVNRAFDNMGYHSTVTPHEEKQFKLGYRIAFREVLEILGDKKFTEEDMTKAIQIAKSSMGVDNDGEHCYSSISNHEIIQSLKQTEWDVEICCYIGNGDKESDSFKDPLVTNTGIPKLDADGCLILRRI